jgi:serine/threonine-protein kinase
MPLLEGGNFAVALSQMASVSYKTSLEVLTLMADALDYAHSKGVIHRDFKLENILLNKYNVPAISDFGIAQSSENTRFTMTGQILGSPKYLAPENFDNASIIDHRVDLYAFAVTAYLMFTGYFPFTGTNPMSIMDKHRQGVFPKPSKVNTQLPVIMDDIFEKALARTAEKRFTSASDFVSRLNTAFINGPEGSATIYLYDENPLSASKPDILPKSSQETINILDLTVISKAAHTAESKRARPAYQKFRRGKVTKPVLALLLGGSLILCSVLGLNIQSSLNSNRDTLNRDPSQLNGNQVFFVTQTVQFLEERARAVSSETATSTPTPSPTEINEAQVEYQSINSFALPEPVPVSAAQSAPVNNPAPRPTNPPRPAENNDGDDGGGSNGGGGNGNGNGNGRGGGRNKD